MQSIRYYAISLNTSYRPEEHITISIAPVLIIEKEDEYSIGYGLHGEINYEFEIKNFHIGPSLGFAIDTEDIHVALGLHLGYGF